MKCTYCEETCIKRGKRKKRQCYQCKECRKYQQKEYVRPRIPKEKYETVRLLYTRSMGICELAEVLQVAKSSIQRMIERLTKKLPRMVLNETGQSYEMDELCTYCGKKKVRIWIMYAINRRTKQIVAFSVGRRTKYNLYKVIKSVLELKPKHIYTDRLNLYKSLIVPGIHKIYPKCTNHIERKNLTLRVRMKRLGRRTLCFTRSMKMLYNTVYLWILGDPFVKTNTAIMRII